MEPEPDAESSLHRELPLLNGERTSEPTPLTLPSDYRPRKAADVLELDMGDGLILYNHDADLVHHLNPSAGVVWQVCDGLASVAQLAAEISEEYHLDVQQIEGQLVTLVAEFDALGLVQDARTDGHHPVHHLRPDS